MNSRVPTAQRCPSRESRRTLLRQLPGPRHSFRRARSRSTRPDLGQRHVLAVALPVPGAPAGRAGARRTPAGASHTSPSCDQGRGSARWRWSGNGAGRAIRVWHRGHNPTGRLSAMLWRVATPPGLRLPTMRCDVVIQEGVLEDDVGVIAPRPSQLRPPADTGRSIRCDLNLCAPAGSRQDHATQPEWLSAIVLKVITPPEPRDGLRAAVGEFVRARLQQRGIPERPNRRGNNSAI